MKNFLLVVPQFVNAGEGYNFPFGIAYVSAYLKKQGYNVYCLNLCHYEKHIPIEQILKEQIEKFNIDVLSTGTMSWYWDKMEAVLQIAKKIKPSIINIVGGAIVVSDPELAMKNLPIDIGIIGEGEITMSELAEAMNKNQSIEDIKGICFLKNNKLIITSPRPVIDDLDSLPFPDYEDFEFNKWLEASINSNTMDLLAGYKKTRYAEIIGSRSCPFSCTFCYHHLGQKYRQRSLENIFAEIDYLINKYNINSVYFLDELFSANHERMINFSRMIKKTDLMGWGAGFRVNDINAEILKVLKDSGIKYMGFGFENMNDEILKSMNKRATSAENENALKLCREAGILCTGNIIIGDPAETEETAEKSLRWVIDHPQYNTPLIFLKAIPDAAIFQYAIKNNLIKDKLKFIRDKFPIINLTKINNKKFFKFRTKVIWLDFSKKHLRIGEVIDTTKIDDSKFGDNIYKVKIKCPFCGHITEHTKCLENSKFISFTCEQCTSTCNVYGSKVFKDQFNSLTANIFYYKWFILIHLEAYEIFREKKELIFSFLVKTKRILKKILNFNY